MAVARPARSPRIRRTKSESREEIKAAARSVLERDGAGQLTVSEVMAHTGMSRKAFYVHFADRSALIRDLVLPLRADLDAAIARWGHDLDPAGAGFEALQQAARTYIEHNGILRALWWTPTDDDELVAARESLLAPLVESARGILESSRGLPDEDAQPIARALATMNVHSLLALGPHPSRKRVAETVGALRWIWVQATRS